MFAYMLQNIKYTNFKTKFVVYNHHNHIYIYIKFKLKIFKQAYNIILDKVRKKKKKS